MWMWFIAHSMCPYSMCPTIKALWVHQRGKGAWQFVRVRGGIGMVGVSGGSKEEQNEVGTAGTLPMFHF